MHRVLSVVQQQGEGQQEGGEDTKTPGQTQSAFALRADYRATTNRMLRVAVNSYMESLRLVVDVMGALDVDVLEEAAQGSNTTS